VNRKVLATFLLAFSLSAFGCRNPSMCECVNGIDCYGRGSNPIFTVQCAAVGSDERCQLLQTEQGLYCPTPNKGKTIDVTSTSQWSSSDPTIAILLGPGVVHTVGSGIVVISAVPPTGVPIAPVAAFNLAPGTVPEQMVHLEVLVEPASTGSAIGAVVSVTQERGSPQSCVTTAAMNSVEGICYFSVFAGTVHIHATNTGLALAGDTSLVAMGSGCFCGLATVRLTPVLSN
jgi:hypothetical protein